MFSKNKIYKIKHLRKFTTKLISEHLLLHCLYGNNYKGKTIFLTV